VFVTRCADKRVRTGFFAIVVCDSAAAARYYDTWCRNKTNCRRNKARGPLPALAAGGFMTRRGRVCQELQVLAGWPNPSPGPCVAPGGHWPHRHRTTGCRRRNGLEM